MYGTVVTALPSAARTTSAGGPAVDTEGVAKVAVLVDVTAVSGTSPSMTIRLEWSHDGTTWFLPDSLESFAAITAAVKRVKEFDVRAPYVRVVHDLSGTTPSFTFAAHVYLNG